MSVDSKLYLPPTTRLKDFEQVLGILLGAKAEQYKIDGSDGVFVRVGDAPKFTGSKAVPEVLVCSIGGFWHWEADDAPFPGARQFSCGMNPHRRGVLVALADIFGGMLDFNDCDSVDVDHLGTLYTKPYHPDASDGDDWDRWQRFKLALQPVSTFEEWGRWNSR